ncbi:EAL domain-containing protein [Marinobacter sp.]|uniref:EAL domain-containing protein n=1 Tax=Marinobacter sp. TaxID=50741 RepID=UPI002B467FF4|nr:EAL domain-containing protein [Marinobacter sp.]HKK55185.1 EAL domain-containing protein [Marinobacter sp.]
MLIHKGPEVFRIFPWNRNFETGLEKIDEQHKVLVDIVNRLARHFASVDSETNSSVLFEELLSYASYHFEYEESVWQETFGDSEVTRNHHDCHQMFFERIQALRQSKEPQESVLADLFDYLTRWLAFHILESDRRMALTARAVIEGTPLKEAKEKADSELSGSVSLMVSALLETYGTLSSSTIQLMQEKMARQQVEDELYQLQKDQWKPLTDDPGTDRQKRMSEESTGGRHWLPAEIAKAIRENQFRLFYQPRVNLRTGAVVGVEALIRWRHPDRGLLLPDDFLPAIANQALLTELGEWVLSEALGQLRDWEQRGISLKIGVNVAALHLQSAGFVAWLKQTLAEFPELDPGRLDLEIQDTAALSDLTQSAAIIRECRNLGVTFSLDDFGTGFSSLSCLRRLPVNTLKIDCELLSGVDDPRESSAILQGVVGLAKAFGYEPAAEGVETDGQAYTLIELGCDHAQGYAIACPLPSDQLEAWLDSWSLAPQFPPKGRD